MKLFSPYKIFVERKRIFYNLYDKQLISLLMAKVTSQTNVFQRYCMKKADKMCFAQAKCNHRRKWKKNGNARSKTEKRGTLDEALLNAKFSIGLMRNFCQLLFIYLFYKLQEVPASFSVTIKNVLTSLEISAFTGTNIFLLTLVHSSKKGPECFVYIELAPRHFTARVKEKITSKEVQKICWQSIWNSHENL